MTLLAVDSLVPGLSSIGLMTLAAFLLGRLAEWRIHRKNYEALRRAGAVELSPTLMRGYYLVTVLVLPGAFLEQALTGALPARWMILVGATLAGVAILLRLWAIRSLGTLWTMRCIAVPGLRHRAVGPYKVIDNPEYLSRLVEGAGICLLLGAEVTLALYVTVTAAYGVYLAGVEREQLAQVDLRKTPEVRS